MKEFLEKLFLVEFHATRALLSMELGPDLG